MRCHVVAEQMSCLFFTWPGKSPVLGSVAFTLFVSRYILLCCGTESLRSGVFEVRALHIFLGLLVMHSFESNTVQMLGNNSHFLPHP